MPVNRCAVCGGQRLVRAIASKDSAGNAWERPGWLCPTHPDAGHLTFDEMADGLASTGVVTRELAVAMLRQEVTLTQLLEASHGLQD